MTATLSSPEFYYSPDGLLDYMQTAIDSGEVVVSKTAREIAPFILLQPRWYAFPLSYPISRMTMALLPHTIREQYGYHLHPVESTGVQIGLNVIRHLTPILPPVLRCVAPYRRTMALLDR